MVFLSDSAFDKDTFLPTGTIWTIIQIEKTRTTLLFNIIPRYYWLAFVPGCEPTVVTFILT